MIADIITIGDELLSGENLNTNSQWLGRYLTNKNIEIRQAVTVSDRLDPVKQALRVSLNEVDLVILTGGLGPTRDDITKEALQDLFQKPLTRHEPTLAHIKEYFNKKGRQMTQSNYRQADVLSNCDVLFNERGTAPGMWFEVEGVGLAVLPGVPYEMKVLMREKVQAKIERLKGWKERTPEVIHYLQTAGVGESTLSDSMLPRLNEFESDELTVAFLPHAGGVTLRVNSWASDIDKARERAEPVLSYIRSRISDHLFHEGRERSMEKVLGERLLEKKLSIAAAESCTGGLLMNKLTDVPGSSEYVKGGMVAYSNEIKQRYLEISEQMLNEHGAVSKPVALHMARAAARVFGADVGISTTGIAGPSGGTEAKPVGTIWIGYYSEDEHFAVKTVFSKDRLTNKQKSVAVAMDLMRRRIEGIETYPYDLQPEFA